MPNLFRGRGQQHTQAKDTQQATRLLPETPLIDQAMPSGIPPEGKVTVTIWTHKIDGLTESDFILGAKIDQLPR